MKNKRIIWIVLAALVLAVAAAAVWAWNSARRCEREAVTVQYELETDLKAPIRVVQLTDLHGKVFGEDNDLLIRMTAEARPDLILMTGDMVDMGDENADVTCALIRALTEIAPVYYSCGNHKYAWMPMVKV